MNLRLLSIALAAFAFVNVNAAIQWQEVNIRNNNVRLDNDERLEVSQIKICRYNPERQEVICVTHDGEPITIANVQRITASSTGTPPWLQYTKGYVGQSESSAGTGAYGSATRYIYLKK